MRVLLVCVVASLLTVVNVSAAETACSSVTVVATFSSRTTLHVSSDVLQFDVTNAEEPAVTSIDFVAAARTHAGGPVVLSIEPPPRLSASLSFSGDGDGLRTGTVAVDAPTVAGQWTGSGVRRGRLVFALRSPQAASAVIPIRFVLSAP
jgi:hypothetical protein